MLFKTVPNGTRLFSKTIRKYVRYYPIVEVRSFKVSKPDRRLHANSINAKTLSKN